MKPQHICLCNLCCCSSVHPHPRPQPETFPWPAAFCPPPCTVNSIAQNKEVHKRHNTGQGQASYQLQLCILATYRILTGEIQPKVMPSNAPRGPCTFKTFVPHFCACSCRERENPCIHVCTCTSLHTFANTCACACASGWLGVSLLICVCLCLHSVCWCRLPFPLHMSLWRCA